MGNSIPMLLAALAAGGFNQGNPIDDAANEALKSVIQYGGTGGTGRSGYNFVPEDVEPQAILASWTDAQLNFFRRIPHIKAASPRHEFQRITTHDPQGMHRAMTTDEGGLGQTSAFQGERVIIHLKEIQAVNVATQLAIETKTLNLYGTTNALDANRTAQMLGLKARMGLNGWWMNDSTDTNENNWQGWFQQWVAAHANSVLYPDNPFNLPTEYWRDPRVTGGNAGPLTRDAVLDASHIVNQHGQGRMTDLWTDSMMVKAAQKELQGSLVTEFIEVDAKKALGLVSGAPVKGYTLGGIQTSLLTDYFLDPDLYWIEFTATPSDGAPAAPGAAPSTAVAAGGAKSLWQASDVLGTVKYKVQPINKKGMGTASAASAATNPVVGDKVTVTWNSSPDATGYRILRNTYLQPNKYYEIGRVGNTAGALSFVDYNWLIPGARWAIGFEMGAGLSQDSDTLYPANASQNTIAMADLNGRGLTRRELAAINNSQREMVFAFTAPQLNLPRRMVFLPNLLDAVRS